MRYDVSLRIYCSYANPADAGRHLLHLMPADLPGEQRLIAGNLEITPEPDEQVTRTDFFGNGLVEIAYRFAHTEIEYSLQARVERFARTAAFDVSPEPGALARELAAVRSLDPASPLHFLAASPHVPLEPEIAAYGRDILGDGMTTFEAVRRIGLALHRDMRFDPEATTVGTPISEAFARRHGVCQDFTHVMISCLRGIGIPAGYVSGYLRTIAPKGRPRLEGADAMHAWVRAWCGVETGWVEFDPTNAMLVSTDHVVVARGRDYSDVAPVKGVLRTVGPQTSEQAVDVTPLKGGSDG